MVNLFCISPGKSKVKGQSFINAVFPAQKEETSNTCRTLNSDFLICSLYLFKLGLAPQIQDLLGKVDFTGKEMPI